MWIIPWQRPISSFESPCGSGPKTIATGPRSAAARSCGAISSGVPIMPRRMTPGRERGGRESEDAIADRLADVGHHAGGIENAQAVRGQPPGFEVVG